MIIDTSALVAILCDEPERRAFNEAIEGADEPALSTATLVECSVVLEARFGDAGLLHLDRFLARAGIEVTPFDLAQAHAARIAYSVYGKGRHPAALNVGDCFSYALAKVREVPLLYKGDDSSRTDIASACPQRL